MRRTAAAEAIAADKPPSAANPTANAPATTAVPIRISLTPGPVLSEPAGGGPTSAGGIGTGSAGATESPVPEPGAAAAAGMAAANRRQKDRSSAERIFMRGSSLQSRPVI